MIEKHGSAVWKGSLQDGGGSISTESGAMDKVSYAYSTRFEDKSGTNPEELIGAAHAACYSMFLAAIMGKQDIRPEAIETTSTITLDPDGDGGPTVTKAHLETRIKADAEEAKIRELADKAKTGCPISKLLNANVSIDVTIG